MHGVRKAGGGSAAPPAADACGYVDQSCAQQVFLQGAAGSGAAAFVAAQHEREGCLLVLLPCLSKEQDSSRGRELPAFPLPGRTAELCVHTWTDGAVSFQLALLGFAFTQPLPLATAKLLQPLLFGAPKVTFAATIRTSHLSASSEGVDLSDGGSTAAPCLSSLLSSCSHTLSEHSLRLTSEHHSATRWRAMLAPRGGCPAEQTALQLLWRWCELS